MKLGIVHDEEILKGIADRVAEAERGESASLDEAYAYWRAAASHREAEEQHRSTGSAESRAASLTLFGALVGFAFAASATAIVRMLGAARAETPSTTADRLGSPSHRPPYSYEERTVTAARETSITL